MNELGRIIKLRRIAAGLSLKELAAKSGVSSSYLGRLERGERSPSARVLGKLARPLGFGEAEMLTIAGLLPPQSGAEATIGRLDPYVSLVLSQEPVKTQQAVIAILGISKSIAKESDCALDFTEYAHRKYPKLDEDTVIMIKDILERSLEGK